jgi:hypothetical protein
MPGPGSYWLGEEEEQEVLYSRSVKKEISSKALADGPVSIPSGELVVAKYCCLTAAAKDESTAFC